MAVGIFISIFTHVAVTAIEVIFADLDSLTVTGVKTLLFAATRPAEGAAVFSVEVERTGKKEADGECDVVAKVVAS